MARQIQIRRGTTAEHESFTGAIGEITMDTDAKTLRVHDGETAGGIPLARTDQASAPGGDVSLPAGCDFVIESASGLSGENYINGWYRKYQSGWLEQGGLTAPNVVSGHITLPMAMSNNLYCTMLSVSSEFNLSSDSGNFAIGEKSPTGFVFVRSINQTRTISWETKGFAA